MKKKKGFEDVRASEAKKERHGGGGGEGDKAFKESTWQGLILEGFFFS